MKKTGPLFSIVYDGPYNTAQVDIVAVAAYTKIQTVNLDQTADGHTILPPEIKLIP